MFEIIREAVSIALSQYCNRGIIKEDLRFEDNSIGYHHGQTDMRLDVFDNGELVAYVEYSIYRNEVQISMIQSIKKGMGYGAAAIKELAKKYGYENIDSGMLTDDGAKLKKKMDRFFGTSFEQNKIAKSGRFSKADLERVPDNLIRSFLLYAYDHGKSAAMDKFGSKLVSGGYFRKYDDLNWWFDILEWTEGAKDDMQDYDGTPDEIKEYFKNLMSI